MQNIKFLSTATLIATMGVAFTACSNEEVVDTQAQTFTGETVKTRFALSLPNNYTRNTRMSADDTQFGGTTFNGVEKIKLYGFVVSTAGNLVEGTTALPDATTKFVKTSFDNQVEMTTSKEQTGYYIDVPVPVGINSFLVYANQSPSGTDAAAAFKRGKTIWTDNLDAATEQPQGNISFAPAAIAENIDFNGVDEGKLLKQILVKVEAATDGVKPWRATAKDGFKDFYNKFINDAKVYAGSSANVHALLQSLYKELSVPTITTDPLAVAIKAAITTGVTSNAKKAQLKVSGTNDLVWSTDNGNADPAFPSTSHNLPDGSAAIKWTKSTDEAVPSTVEFVTASYDGWQQTANRFAYPAELLYYVNSGIYVADSEKRGNRPSTTWENFLQTQYNAANKVVTTSTKSVAIVKPMQYGVANLVVKAKFDTQTPKDKKDKAIDIKPTGGVAGFPLNAVMVGDQKKVDWEFKYDNTGDAHVIYDKAIGTLRVSNYEMATPNYTLVYQSKGVDNPAAAVSEANKEEVNIAIELINDKEDFNGVDGGLIAKGTKFYLIGKITFKTPSGNLKNIFLQDHKTIANLKISSLKNAYNIIPDLRSPKLELGLAVDITWQQGVTADVTIE